MNKEGFTLIETILYIAISAILITSVSAFLVFMWQSKSKITAINEVEIQGKNIMQMINRDIREAASISTPSAQSTSTSLILLGDQQKTYSVNQGNIYLSIDGGGNQVIHNDRVVISNLVFTNMSAVDTPGIIRSQFDIKYKNIDNRQDREYKKTFSSSAAIRP